MHAVCIGGDRNGSAFSRLQLLLLDDSVIAPVMDTDKSDKSKSFLDTKQFAATRQNGGKLKLVGEHFGAKRNTDPETWGSLWRLFDRRRTMLSRRSEATLDTSYIRCPDEREYVARLLSTLVHLLKDTIDFSDQVEVYSVVGLSTMLYFF